MSDLTEDGKKTVAELAIRHGISANAVTHMLRAVEAGQGTQAQFNHPEVGGMGQWSLGGMTMIGDMFNNGLKARVDSLCTELSGILRNQSPFASSQSQSSGERSGPGSSLFVQNTNGWPAELGQPTSVGAQNNMRYAYFPSQRRLAIDMGGQMTVYDTGDHQIGGFSQAQSGGQSLSFNSQHGLVRISDLRIVTDTTAAAPVAPSSVPTSQEAVAIQPIGNAPEAAKAPTDKTLPPLEISDDQIFSRIERLADLLGKGIINQAEFDAKKTELLARL
ncbi:SHOCT domain-containing protein [Puniceibacterium sediminis]|uniref:Short C-terminal domain-containing protein n=1 Tax=Puniceibacterium sediminis TaxID=1608407 RepID=A0A238W2Z9_9RHOB|nr:SHOCT domain-containing protein [Puniceibacterium sediminis]SNR40714.1 Short C-terminal domain-containing protein [Puniceibacterium sediminis]